MIPSKTAASSAAGCWMEIQTPQHLLPSITHAPRPMEGFTPPGVGPLTKLSALLIAMVAIVSIYFSCLSEGYADHCVVPDIPVPQVNNLGECLEACDKTSGCIDVSYVNGTPGPCYLKNTIVPIRPNSNIWGGRQITGCKTTTQATVKLHRKRVVNEKRPILPRGIPIGPDYTFFSTTTTVTRTSTYLAAASTT